MGAYLPLLMIVGVALLLSSEARLGHALYVGRDAAALGLGHGKFLAAASVRVCRIGLVSAMSEEGNPRRVFPRAIFASGTLIALICIAGTMAVLMMLPSETVDPKSGVYQAVTERLERYCGSRRCDILAALLVTVENAGGIGLHRCRRCPIPFIVGIDP